MGFIALDATLRKLPGILSDTFAPLAKYSPFYFYLGSDPLNNGMAWGDAAILIGLFVVLVALSIPLWSRRDLRG